MRERRSHAGGTADLAVMVADVVESVRLVQDHGDHFIGLWSMFVREVRDRIVPEQRGEVVKHLGDGVLLLFADVPAALRAGREMLRWLGLQQLAQPEQRQVRLRVGIDHGPVLRNDIDAFGTPVNLAARLAGAAAPDEILLSSNARLQAGAQADGVAEDIGECYFKHLRQSVRCFRVAAPREVPRSQPMSGPAGDDLLLPRIAVLPPRRLAGGKAMAALADLFADSVIGSLSRSPSVRVISRLSTAAAARRRLAATGLASLLGATYVLSGQLVGSGSRWRCNLELADGHRGEVIWARAVAFDPRELLLEDEPVGAAVAGHVFAAIQAHQVRRYRSLPLPSLEAYALQLSALGLMHRAPLEDFAAAQHALDHLIDRHPRAPSPRAWMAKWWVLRTTRGIATRPQEEAARALEHVRAALQVDHDNAMAWSMKGFVQCHMLRDLPAAEASLDRASQADPSEPLAWLFRSVIQGFRDQGEAAWASAETALALSPLDPLRHYYDALASSAAINARRYERGIELARRSLQGNRDHLPTLRALTVALAESGRVSEARETGQRVLQLAPDFRIRDYVAGAPKGSEGSRARYAEAFALAGLPQG